MAKHSDERLQNIVANVKSAAAEANALLLDVALLLRDRGGFPTASVSVENAIEVVRHVRPKLVFLYQDQFDVESEIASTAEEDGDSDNDADEMQSTMHPKLSRLLAKWRARNGQTSFVALGFMAEGILHTAYHNTDWRDDFDQEVEEIRAEIREAGLAAELLSSEKEAEDVREKADILANHAAFSAGRPSFEKRMFLAEQLFPGTNQRKLSDITARADKIDWLKKSGVKP